jgi:hypothetical protein
MPAHAQLGVFRVHACPVVRDAHQERAALRDVHGDRLRSRVDGVFDQLLDYAGRALDHLTSGDLVGQGVVEHVDAGHGPRR